MVKVKLLRPLDGREAGQSAEYPADDAKRLQDMGCVQIVGAKSAAPSRNKMEPAPANKAAPRSRKSGS
jgi:hypothetical protein